MPARPSRRTVVSAVIALPVSLVAGTAAGCTLSAPAPAPSAERRKPAPDPDVALLGEVVDATETMVSLYEGVLARHRDLARDLRPLLAAHREHAAALGEAAPGTTPPTRGTPAGPGPDVPRRRAGALRALQTAERTASADLLGQTRRAASGTFARLLASMSACSAQHVRVLREVAG